MDRRSSFFAELVSVQADRSLSLFLSNDGSINDVCGDFSMTLIDVIDTFVVLGNRTAFEEGSVFQPREGNKTLAEVVRLPRRRVRTIIQTVSFNKDVKVQGEENFSLCGYQMS